MLYFTKNITECTGCSACYSVCPVKCISMKKDAEGFLYPDASNACIHCGKCEAVCPIVNGEKPPHPVFEQKAYCALTKDKKIWKRSASGGAFSEICKAFGDEQTLICGAAWDGLNVHHICVEGVKNIAPLCKSKYVASAPENVFSEIKVYLRNEKRVVFCGTPCQIAGLKHMLGKEYPNLLLIDLICHGVGSNDVFQACVSQIGEQFNDRVKEYEFRAKTDAFYTDYLSKIVSDKGETKYLLKDQYIQLFLNQLCLRPSCGGNCRYRNENRQGDLTIADFKGLTQVFPGLTGTKRNYSAIVVNTEKGDAVVNRLKNSMHILNCSINDIKEYNPLFFRHTWSSLDRDAFFGDFQSDPCETIKKWTSPATVYETRLRRKIYDILPVFIRRFVIRK